MKRWFSTSFLEAHAYSPWRQSPSVRDGYRGRYFKECECSYAPRHGIKLNYSHKEKDRWENFTDSNKNLLLWTYSYTVLMSECWRKGRAPDLTDWLTAEIAGPNPEQHSIKQTASCNEQCQLFIRVAWNYYFAYTIISQWILWKLYVPRIRKFWQRLISDLWWTSHARLFSISKRGNGIKSSTYSLPARLFFTLSLVR